MNKKLILTMFLSMFMLSMTFAVTLDDAEVYYSFDETDTTGTTMIDISGTPQYNGTCTNMGGDCNTVVGKIINATVLDGNDDYINAGDLTGAETTKSINFWYNPSNAGTAEYLIEAYGTGGVNRWRFRRLATNELEFLTISGGTHTSSGVSLTNGVWSMITLTLDSSANKILMYQNGVVKLNETYSDDFLNSNVWTIGWEETAGNYDYAQYDELAVYNKVLNSSEISELYNGGTGYNPYTVVPIIVPIITTNLTNGTYFMTNNISIEVNTSQIANVTYILDGGNVTSLYNNSFSGVLNLFNLSQIQHNITFNATNDNGSSQLYQNFYIDLTPPVIINNLPNETNSYLLNISQYVTCQEIDGGLCNITFTPDGNTVLVNQTSLYNFTYNGNQSYNIQAEDLAGNKVNKSGVILVNPYAYFSFSNGSTAITNYSLGGIDFETEANITLYDSVIGGLGNKTLLFEKVGYASTNISFTVTNTSRINITTNITSSKIILHIYDRDTNQILTGLSTVTVIATVGYNTTTTTGHVNISDINFIEETYQIIVAHDGYEPETIYFDYDNQQEIMKNIYLLNNTASDFGQVEVLVKSEDGEFVIGAIVNLLEWKPAQSAYVTVSQGQTNNDGSAFVPVQFGTRLYKFSASSGGLTTTSPSQIVYDSGAQVTLTLILETSAEELETDLQNINYNVTNTTYNATAQTIRYEFSDSNFVAHEACLNTYRVNGLARVLITDESECVTTDSGIINKIVDTNNSFTKYVIATIEVDGKTYTLKTFRYEDNSSFWYELSSWNLHIFVPVLLFLTFLGLGVLTSNVYVMAIGAYASICISFFILPSIVSGTVFAFSTVILGLTVWGVYKR